MKAKRTIRLDDTMDWGAVDASDEDRASYEQTIADAIAKRYPDAEVTVRCLQIADARVVVMTRNEAGRIMTDDATCREESEIEETVLEIARAVWDAGEFWVEVQS